MKISIVVLICLLSFPLSGHSKRTSISVNSFLPIEKTVGNNYSIAPGIDVLTIPLKRVGNLFMIDTNVDNQIGNLIFDTGAM